MNNDVIIALSTPCGLGALAVIRISGLGCHKIADNFFKGKIHLINGKSNTCYYGNFCSDNHIIDDVLITLFDNGYTNEESLEISCHNSKYIIKTIIDSFINVGVRLALPGEFTQRAFLNGRFDLIQAESVADIINSDNQLSNTLARNQFNGYLSKQLNTIHNDLLTISASLELELDFSQEDITFVDRNELKHKIEDTMNVINELLENFKIGQMIKDGIYIAIIGEPNVGKSSLLNLLLNDDRAIVSDISGTTRDTIEEVTYINDLKCRFIDTAGLKDVTNDIVESIGIEKSKKAAQKSNIIIYLSDVSTSNEINQKHISFIKSMNKPYIHVINKIDLNNKINDDQSILISVKNNTNIDILKTSIIDTLEINKISDSSLVINARHYDVLSKCKNSLLKIIEDLSNNVSNEFLMIYMKDILNNFGLLTNKITSEDILSSIFSKFCIGK